MKIKNKLQLKYLKIDTDEYEVERDDDSEDDDKDNEYEEKTMATYIDPNNNIEIILHIKDENNIHLGILNGQEDRDKPPAPKGLTRNILCNILKHLVDKNLIKISTNMTLSPGDLGGQTGREHDQDKLENMYKNMGFVEIRNTGKWSQSVKDFLKWCHSKYPDTDKEHSCPHPMPEPVQEPEPTPEPMNEFDEDQDTYEDETDDEEDYDLDFTDDEYATDHEYDQETDDDLTEEDYERMQEPEPAKQMEMPTPIQQKEVLKPVPRIKTYEDYFHNA